MPQSVDPHGDSDSFYEVCRPAPPRGRAETTAVQSAHMGPGAWG